MRRGRGAAFGGAIAVIALAALGTNCSGGSGGAGGTTGTAGIGGSTGGRAGTTGRGGSGTAGSSGPGGTTTGGTTGSAGSGGTTGAAGTGGTTGAAGTGGTTGAAGTGGTTGSAGTGGTTGSAGTGGTTGGAGTGGTTGGAGTGGTTGGGGTGGTTGAAGSGGTTGAAGSGGTTGSAGSGGTTGSAGSGGTTGSAGSGGTTGSAGSGGTTGTGGGTGGTSSGGGTPMCDIPSGSGTITQQFGDAHVLCPKDYIVQNNAWGSTAGQAITFGLGTKFKVTVQNETRTNNSTPAGYPSIFTGANNNRSTTGSGLPRAISAIAAGSLATSFTWATNGATGSYNAAYDVWFSTGSGGDPSASSPSGGFLMIWFNDSPQNQPIGAVIANGTVTIGGKPFSIWYGMNGSRPCVSYIAQEDLFTWTFSLGDFIQDAITRNCSGTTKCVNPSWYLTNVFAGFEIWNGGVGLEVKDFGVTVP